MEMEIVENEKRIKFNSFLTAVFLSEASVCSLIGLYLPISGLSGIMMILLILVILLHNKFKIEVSKKSLIAYWTILGLLVLSYTINMSSYAIEYLEYYLCFGTASFLLSNQKICIKTFLKYFAILNIFILIAYFVFQRSKFLTSDTYWGEQMGVAYEFVPIVIVCAIVLLFKEYFILKNWTKILVVIVAVASMYVILIDCGTRGAIVSVVLGISLLITCKVKGVKQWFILLLGLISLIIIVYNIQSIVDVILKNYSGTGLLALQKYAQMASRGDASNGRIDIYKNAIDIFWSNPIIGHGIGYFEKIYGGVVHQFFFQILCEYGLVGLIVVLYYLIRDIVKTVMANTSLDKIYKIFLFSISLIVLQYSSSTWILPCFWLYFFMII